MNAVACTSVTTTFECAVLQVLYMLYSCLAIVMVDKFYWTLHIDIGLTDELVV